MFYFSDGCAEKYKNYKQFVNLRHHKLDFEIVAEWIFFATIREKSPCDSIGGFMKPYAVKQSLQRPLEDQILSYVSMFNLFNLKSKASDFLVLVNAK